MLIVCSACATTYDIDPASLGAGRRVRCSRCKATWFATVETPNQAWAESAATRPLEADFGGSHAPRIVIAHDAEAAGPAAVVDAPPLVPPLAEANDPGETAERTASRQWWQRSRRKPKHTFPRWVAPLLLLFACGVAIVEARDEVARYWPRAAALFAAVGLPVGAK